MTVMSLTEFIDTLTGSTENPHKFLSVQENVECTVKNLLKSLYDYAKANEEKCNNKTLPSLIIDGFDDEQIWQELELHNDSSSNDLIKTLPVLSAKIEKLKFPLDLKCLRVKEPSPPLEENSDDRIIHESNEGIDDDDGDQDEEEFLTDDDDVVNQPNLKKTLKKGKQRPSIVDDKFFKLSELELFLNSEDKSENKPKRDADAIDLFENTDTDATGPDYKYSDFFENPDGEDTINDDNDEDDGEDAEGEEGEEEEVSDYDEDENENDVNSTKRKLSEVEEDGSSDDDEPLKDKNAKKVRFSLMSDDEEEESEDESDLLGEKKKNKKEQVGSKSSLEERKERLGAVIGRLEEEALGERPWQLSGEVGAASRPENSLLQEIVDFDLSVRPAPVITGEVCLRLEDMIKRRVLDKAWDDVERKVKPVEDNPAEFKKRLALDQEKSKLSLAQVYEQEYIRQREAAGGGDGGGGEGEGQREKEPPLHAEVRSLSAALFNKLDALSNYHYTPRPVAAELRVLTNVAAVAMEEVAPVSTADSALLAPQEISAKKRDTDLKSKEERTKTDKKRERRLKKAKQRQRKRDSEKKAKEGAKTGKKYSKINAAATLSLSNVTKMNETKEKPVRSSTAFFDKLQDEVKSQIKSKSRTSSSANNKDNMRKSAKKLKL